MAAWNLRHEGRYRRALACADGWFERWVGGEGFADSVVVLRGGGDAANSACAMLEAWVDGEQRADLVERMDRHGSATMQQCSVSTQAGGDGTPLDAVCSYRSSCTSDMAAALCWRCFIATRGKQVGDPSTSRFRRHGRAENWLEENDLEGVAFEYEVSNERRHQRGGFNRKRSDLLSARNTAGE